MLGTAQDPTTTTTTTTAPRQLSGMIALRELSLRRCGDLASVRELLTLMTPTIDGAPTSLSSTSNFLTKVDFSGCHRLVSLEGIAVLAPLLEDINVSSCRALASLQPLHACHALTTVDAQHCAALLSLDGLENHARLTTVDASYAGLTCIRALGQGCPALREVFVCSCGDLASLEGLGSGGSGAFLREVNASFTGITSVRALHPTLCPALTNVNVYGCSELASLEGLEGHDHLVEVSASFTAIASLAPLLDRCPALKKVLVCGCEHLPASNPHNDETLFEASHGN